MIAGRALEKRQALTASAATGPNRANMGAAEYPEGPGPLSPPLGFTSVFLRRRARPEFTTSYPFYFTFARAGSGASAFRFCVCSERWGVEVGLLKRGGPK